MLKIEVRRNRQSYDFKADANKKDGFDNNWKNNSLDMLLLFDDKKILFAAYAQTVANYCFGEQGTGDTLPHGDTVAEGEFTVRCFVEPRAFDLLNGSLVLAYQDLLGLDKELFGIQITLSNFFLMGRKIHL